MNLRQVPGARALRPEFLSPAMLRGHWARGARALWMLLAFTVLALFVASLFAYYNQALILTAPAIRDPGHRSMGNPEMIRAALRDLGLSVRFYASYTTAIFALFGAVYAGVGLTIFSRKPNERVALAVSLWLVTFGATFTPAWLSLNGIAPVFDLFGLVVSYVGFLAFFLLFFLFPDGRFVPGWTRWVALYLVAGFTLNLLFPNGPFDPSTSGPLGVAMLLLVLGSMVSAQVYRYRRVSGPVERQQTKWVVFGLAMAMLSFLGFGLPEALFPELSQPHAAGLLYDMVSSTVGVLAFLLVPLSIAVAILRYRLWDIDLIINRALVYGALTALVVGLYVLLVGGLGAILQMRSNLLVSLLATGLVAILFAPLRDRLQRGVNRLMYGERDEPYMALSRLGQRLEDSIQADAVFTAIVQSVRDALRLPYVAIELDQEDELTVSASIGRPTPNPLSLPLTYGGERVGELVLAPRSGTKGFSVADRRLIDDLARHAGVAAHAIRLTANLQKSNQNLRTARERLVTAREEERRRLRRDLHDGLGPQLAGFTLRLDAARNLLREDPDAADRLLEGLSQNAQVAVSDIRRLVYALRPPALDDLGLVAALRQHAAQYAPTGLRVCVEAPDSLPPLTAAVEVAAYRIAQEGLANVARHSGAESCSVRISLDEGALCLEVKDDGRGLPTQRQSGVGLLSMRERAEELGGACVVASAFGGGTSVRVRLPLSNEGRRG